MNTSTTERITGYSKALLAVARAEGLQSEIETELEGFAQSLQHNDKLRSVLADSSADVQQRMQVVEKVLADRVRPVTIALILMVMRAGRGDELFDIVDMLVDVAAADQNRRVARVRSAVRLSDEQQDRLAEAIKTSSGLDVEVHTIVDPSVVGGAITEIDDHVIDGSLRRRLQKMRADLT